MLTFAGAAHPDCRRPERREFLRIGALGMGGLTLPALLRQQARAEAASRPKSVIYIVLSGGPSHIDMWDPKPEAPAEYRGPFHPLATRLPGVHLSELQPRQAAMMDQLALLRGIRSVENDHFLSEVYTGLPRSAGNRPAFGSVVSRLTGRPADLPPYVCLAPGTTDQFEYEKPYYAGAGHGPFRPMGGPERGRESIIRYMKKVLSSRVALGITPQGSHRSVRAQLRHTARQVRD